jgi:hypothetical protein
VSPTPSLIIELNSLVLLSLRSLAKEVSVLLVGNLLIAGIVPEVGSVVTVGVLQSSEASLDGVTKGTGMTTRGGVDIINTSKSKELLEGRRSNNTRTTRSRNQTHTDGTALTSNLNGNSVDLTRVLTPITTTDGDDGHLSNKDSTTNSSGNFLTALGTKTNVTVAITNGDESLETGSLTSSGLLLDRENLHDFILKVGKKLIDNFRLLDGKGEGINLLNRGDLVSLHQTTNLGHGDPFLRLLNVTTRTAGLTATATRTAFSSRLSSGSLSGNFNRNFNRNYGLYTSYYFKIYLQP